eukprot:TRINITY_DN12335_c0_g2_i4.p2 TRINITY_DN12335_c0_g2~~TRINITY_DN12335_c0_g2_i4.p2  ORF type:complete len:293 (+),score=86.14 TRINITY_DN12335_c0_g2_i4:1449-2327(+)
MAFTNPTDDDDFPALPTPAVNMPATGGLFSPPTTDVNSFSTINPSSLAMAATFPSTGYSVPGMSLPAPDAAAFSESFFAKFLANEDLALSALNEPTTSSSTATVTTTQSSAPMSTSTSMQASSAATPTTNATLPPDVASSEFQQSQPVPSSASKKGAKPKPNKQAADRYRKKKREEFERLQVETEKMKNDNTELKIKLAKLEDESKFLSSLLVTTVKNTQSPLVTLQKLPDHLITDDMLPENVKAEDFCKYRNVIASILQAQQRQETQRLEQLEMQVAAAMQMMENQPTGSS